MLHHLDLDQIAAAPWKNGGGSTRELCCWPPAADMDHFDWRISLASITQAGPFSAFPGVDRQIALLSGDGVSLHGPGLAHRLDQRWAPFAFSGDLAVDCQLLGGPSSDLNVMTRRGRWQAEMELRGQDCALGLSPAGLCLVLEGRWQSSLGQLLPPGQGRWWSQAAAETLTPLDPQASLMLISLRPVAA